LPYHLKIETHTEVISGVVEIQKAKNVTLGKCDGKKLGFEIRQHGSTFHEIRSWGWVDIMKELYKGLFVYHHQMCKEFTWAYSEAQAKTMMCRRLAKRQGVYPSVVFGYFSGDKDNYRIQKEIEINED